MQFFQDKLKSEGWTIANVTKMEGVNMVTAKKGSRQCSVMFSTEDKLTVAVIMTSVAGK
jgi:hypothetical protein